MNWSRPFEDPIPIPGRKPIRTLREAAQYVTALPKAEQSKPHWQDAAEALMLVAELGGDPMLARIGMMRAINYGKPEPAKQRSVKAYRLIR